MNWCEVKQHLSQFPLSDDSGSDGLEQLGAAHTAEVCVTRISYVTPQSRSENAAFSFTAWNRSGSYQKLQKAEMPSKSP